MTTFATLVSDTERHLLSGDREELNKLGASMLAADTTLTYTYDATQIAQGSYLAVDLEVLYVWTVDESRRVALVERGMVGSTAADHVDTSLVQVNPKFSKFDIANAINQEIRSLSAPPSGLFQVKDFTVTTQPVQRTYAVPVLNTDVLSILEIRYDAPGAEMEWPRVTRDEFSVLREMPTNGFPSGMAVRLDVPVYPGRDMRIVYAAPFTELATLTDDVTVVSGLPATAVDIPPLGAAARLMGVREAKRSFVENEMDPRRAGEVPPGSSSRAAQVLLSLMNTRINTEYLRLIQQYPDRR
jgi:hypothetical protein